MRCDHCKKNEATTHIKQNINGKKSEVYLCETCASELNVLEDMQPLSMDTMFADTFFGNFLGAGLAAMNSLAGVERCNYCSSSFNDIVQTGNVGCAHCYSKFYDKLEPSIRKIHGKTGHIGKNISYVVDNDAEQEKPTQEKTQESELQKLKAQLDKAVLEQRFEDAAILRDKISAVQAEG